MFLNGKALLQTVDTATRSSATTLLDSHGASYGYLLERIRFTPVMTSCSMYIGYLKGPRTDQRSIFTSVKWKQLTDLQGIQLKRSGKGAHSSSKVGERNHKPLGRIYRKIQFSNPEVAPAYILQVAAKQMSDTIGKTDWFSLDLFLEFFPRFPIIIDQPKKV